VILIICGCHFVAFLHFTTKLHKRFTLIEDLLPPFQDPALNGVNITPTSQIHMVSMLILLMAGNLKYKGGSMMSIQRLMKICHLVQGHNKKSKESRLKATFSVVKSTHFEIN
jgi:hypothetical protein